MAPLLHRAAIISKLQLESLNTVKIISNIRTYSIFHCTFLLCGLLFYLLQLLKFNLSAIIEGMPGSDAPPRKDAVDSASIRYKLREGTLLHSKRQPVEDSVI